MEQIIERKVGGLAIENHSVLRLFLKYKIDFFCKGNLSLKEALINSNIEENIFIDELKEVINERNSNFEVKVEEWPLDLLADYIQKTHHKFTDHVLVNLKSMVNQFLEINSNNTEVIERFKEQLLMLAKELGGHMKKEELILFPYIRKMIMSREKLEAPRFKTVQNPIDMMIHEHDTAFNLLENIRGLFHDYKLDSRDSQELADIVKLMEELDQDLALHLHLENNILFPKVLELEKNKVIL